MKRSKRDLEPRREGFTDWTPRVRTGRGRLPAVLLVALVVLPSAICGVGSLALGVSGPTARNAEAEFGGLFKALGVGFLLLSTLMVLLARKRWRE